MHIDAATSLWFAALKDEYNVIKADFLIIVAESKEEVNKIIVLSYVD